MKDIKSATAIARTQVSGLEFLLLHLPGIIVDESDAELDAGGSEGWTHERPASDAELDAGGSEDVAAPGGPWAVWLWPCEDVAAPGGGGYGGRGVFGGGGAWRYSVPSGRF